jgi:CRISPR/Cas system CMR-associated protein Cmr3 (group 5 of RAMP superfamily)
MKGGCFLENSIDQLLQDYRSIWNNRLLQNEGQESIQILREAIKRELNDENSHPRIRRSKHEKFYLATKRIMEATIPIQSKIDLLLLHQKMMEEK